MGTRRCLAGGTPQLTVFSLLKISWSIRRVFGLLSGRHIDIQAQSVRIFEGMQDGTVEANPVDRYRFHIVPVNRFFLLDQRDGIGSFLTIAWQHIDLRDDFAVRVDKNVQQVTVEPVPMPGSPSVGVRHTADLVAASRMFLVVEYLVSNPAAVE